MSSYPQASAGPASATSARPATLLVAIGAAVVAALAAIINGAMVVFDKTGYVVTKLAEETGLAADQVEARLGGTEAIKAMTESDDFQPVMTRNWAVLICGVLLLVFGILMYRAAATWTRVLVTIFALGTAGFSLLIASIKEDATDMASLLGWIALAVGVIALVLTWLPANGRYAKAVR